MISEEEFLTARMNLSDAIKSLTAVLNAVTPESLTPKELRRWEDSPVDKIQAVTELADALAAELVGDDSDGEGRPKLVYLCSCGGVGC